MPAFTFTSPDGKSYTVNGPDGATQDQAFQMLQKQLGATPAAPRTWGDVPLDALKNAPKSAANLLGGIADAVIHPIRTVGTALDIGAGALRNALPDGLVSAIDSMDSSQQHQGALNASDVAGKVGQFYKQRYGGEQNLRDTLATDPVGALADATAVLQGGAGVARMAGKLPVVAGPAGQVAGALDLAANATNPVTPVVNGVRSLYSRAIPYVAQKPGNLLASAIGGDTDTLRAIAEAAKAAPDSIVPGSNLTLSQAIALQGAKNPNVALLERTAAGGPGGNVLTQRYIDQGAARLEALKNNGAVVYDGAPATVAENTGNKIASVLRTQFGDDQAAARAAWESVHGVAGRDGVSLMLPLEDMQSAMSPLGRGTVGAGNKARSLVSEAENIGQVIPDEIKPISTQSVNKSQTLEQAVRSEGGIRGGSGELRDLGIKQSGTTGLVNNKSGQAADILAQKMYERGFIPDSDPATLMDALRNGGGRKVFATDAVENNAARSRYESAMGDAPPVAPVPVPVPFSEFQRLRRSAGELGAQVAEKGSPTEAGVLNKIQSLLSDTADRAASPEGSMLGHNMTPEFLQQYNAARDLTRQNAEMYKSGNNITQILRKPAGQNYTLSGNEVTSKLWHGGQGLVGDVQSLKNTLSGDNFNPVIDSLRTHVMTDAASKTTASGNLASGFPAYVENRLPGLQELMSHDQLDALTKVAKDIKNAAAADDIGIKGSDTQAKISRALDAGMLDSVLAKSVAKYTSLKGIGGETIRNKLSQIIMDNKGKTIAGLLADPKSAAAALQDANFASTLDAPTLKQLSITARLAPIAVDRLSEYQK